jgi:tRNA-specific 2-thiouridylase
MTGKKKVFVAMSGGVDSSTAAALLLEAGFDCAGVFMITSDQAQQAQGDAEKVAGKLGIKLYVLDLRGEFEQILNYFCSEYKRGRTPNPCVLCNRKIKFGRLLSFARDNGAELFATGHYARILEAGGCAGLYQATDNRKDQSYALAMIDKKALAYIILPMGDYSKEQTREMAKKFGLGLEGKKESQEICFIPDNDYVAALETRWPELVHKGKIVDGTGEVLGEHNGTHRFTIGQRQGLRVAMGKPYYVVRIDAETNTVTLGPKEEVMHKRLSATGVNWLIDRPQASFRARVRVRYNNRGAQATVFPEDDSVTVEFDEPIAAITPGQLAVFYIQEGENSRVAGGGWIENATD